MKRFLSIILILLIMFGLPQGVYAKPIKGGETFVSSIRIEPSAPEINVGDSVTFNATWSTNLGVNSSEWLVDGLGQGINKMKPEKKSGSSSFKYTGSTEGTHIITFRIWNNKYVGTRDASQSVSVIVKTIVYSDTTPPISLSLITSGTSGTNGWYTSDVGVQITATDTDGSGVKEIHYILNNGTPVVIRGYWVPLTISTEGINTLVYWAVDNANNSEEPKGETIKIDRTKPIVEVSAKNADNTTYTSGTPTNQNVTVTLSASDNNLISFKVDDVEKYLYGTASATIDIIDEGTKTINYIAVDDANNKTIGSFVVCIIKTEPVKPTYYVALGDSIATGSNSRGTTNSYVKGFYEYLLSKDPLAAYKNLSINGDKSIDLLNHLLEEGSEIETEVKKATVITISIGGNNIMAAARGSFFSSIDTAIAEDGTKAFENEYSQIISTIRNLNPDVKILVSTLYNPYNTIGISGYTEDPALQIIAEGYIRRINDQIKNVVDSKYHVAEVHDYFLEKYAKLGKMGNITYFYPWSLLKITRDPHPNQTGQNIILDLHKGVYPIN